MVYAGRDLADETIRERSEGGRKMAAPPVRVRDKDRLAQFLGWFSLGLGTAQVTAPRAMCRLIGARGKGAAPIIMRLMGLREIAQGVGILARPRPVGWLWSRVAGDGLDLSLLTLTALQNRERRGRTAVAIANVLAVTVPDVLESMQLSRKDGEPKRGMLVRKAVTINRPRDEVQGAWAAAVDLRLKIQEVGGSVTFSDAPGNRGTELAVDFIDAPPAGDLGAAVLKLTGRELATQLSDDLRRFKQLVETGEITRSDSTPDGHLLAEHLRQRAAQPLREAVR
jgi:uncharacterized membrane protein